ncbi:hypothetical protein Sango_2313700 [Sesamum angolense]|uniref:Integrase zinc-binding domain-containing protein n=1 Tax=Sesamum angolense TaxID=2727404 RepID=A0AAE1WAG3_9LAMI|nr:hypothetical protein Sango_2313700 [Sesamum angolense]
MEIMHEAHYAPYAIPGSTKMCRDLRPYYWWPTMKKDVAEFVARCLTCQQVKTEHQTPAVGTGTIIYHRWNSLIKTVFTPVLVWPRMKLCTDGSVEVQSFGILKIEISEGLTYEEEPIETLDRSMKKLRNKEIPMVKIRWSHHSSREATWEVEEKMREKYPYLFHEPVR